MPTRPAILKLPLAPWGSSITHRIPRGCIVLNVGFNLGLLCVWLGMSPHDDGVEVDRTFTTLARPSDAAMLRRIPGARYAGTAVCGEMMWGVVDLGESPVQRALTAV